jgi:tetratricopeptide (TPR) repeat protein
VLDQAATLAAQVGDDERARQVRRQQVANLISLGRLPECLPHARALAAGFVRGARNPAAADEALLLAQVLMARGSYVEALALCTSIAEGAASARTAGSDGDAHLQDVQYALALMWSLWCAAELGRFEEAMPLVLKAQDALAPDRPLLLRVTGGIGTGVYWLRYGEYLLAADTLAKVLPLAEIDHMRAWFPSVASSLGLALVRCERAKEALPLLMAAVERTPVRGGTGRGLRLAHLAECYLALHDEERALRYAEEAVAFCERVHDLGAAAHARCVLAQAERASQRPEAARANLEAVLRAARELSMVPLEAVAARSLAELK